VFVRVRRLLLPRIDYRKSGNSYNKFMVGGLNLILSDTDVPIVIAGLEWFSSLQIISMETPLEYLHGTYRVWFTHDSASALVLKVFDWGYLPLRVPERSSYRTEVSEY